MNLLLGFYAPWSGRVLLGGTDIGGTDIAALPRDVLHRRVGAVLASARLRRGRTSIVIGHRLSTVRDADTSSRPCPTATPPWWARTAADSAPGSCNQDP